MHPLGGINNEITSVAVLDKDKRPLTRGRESDALYYVFRFGQDEGFAIMGADDRLPELMAIANGTPNQDNPVAELPDTTSWTLPGLDAGVDTATYEPNPDVTALDRPYTKLLKNDQIPVHWGQRDPYNSLIKVEGFADTLELRPPTSCVAVAQILTREEFRSDLVVSYYLDYNRHYVDTIYVNELSRCHDIIGFKRRPNMAQNVAELFRYLQSENGMGMFFPLDMIDYDNVNNVYFVEGIVPFVSAVENYNDVTGRALRRLGFDVENSDVTSMFVPYSAEDMGSQLRLCLSLGYSVIVGGHQFMEPAYIVHNAMHFDDTPQQSYLLVNKCRGRNGDGYYLSSGFKKNFFYIISKSKK